MRKMLFFEGWKVVCMKIVSYRIYFCGVASFVEMVYTMVKIQHSRDGMNMQGDISLDVVLLYAE